MVIRVDWSRNEFYRVFKPMMRRFYLFLLVELFVGNVDLCDGHVLLGTGNHSRLVRLLCVICVFKQLIWLFSTKEHVPNRFWLRWLSNIEQSFQPTENGSSK